MPAMVMPAIVVRYANYRDHDRMLTLLTPAHGCVEALARGCRRPKSALMPGSELFVSGEYTLFCGNERSTVTSCALQDTFYPLRLDSYRLTCATYMAALCAAAVQPGQEAAGIYALLLKGLYYLSYDQECDPLATTTAFLLHFADQLGYRPRLTRCAHCRTPLDLTGGAAFDIMAGGLCCPQCTSRAAYRLTHEEVVWISVSLREGFSAQKEKSPGRLFDLFRRYVESRLDSVIKVSRLLP